MAIVKRASDWEAEFGRKCRSINQVIFQGRAKEMIENILSPITTFSSMLSKLREDVVDAVAPVEELKEGIITAVSDSESAARKLI